MEARQREVVVVLGLAALLAGAGAAAQQASGALTVDGSSHPLVHAYASAQPGFFDKTREDVRVLLSDVPLSDEARSDVFELMQLARGGRAHVVEVVFDADGDPIAGAIFAPVFNGMMSVTGVHHFTAERFERGLVAGRLSMDGERTLGEVTFHYDATFSSVIQRAPTAEELATALASPPALAAEAYLGALRAGNLEAFLEALGESARASYRGGEAERRFAERRAGTPADSRVVGLKREGETAATATIQGHEGGIVIEQVLKLVREDGVWRVGS